MNDMIQKIKNGDYNSKLEYPEHTVKDYRAKRDEWSKDEHRLTMAFKADALEDLELSDHPNADKIWDKAYEDGHSSGLEQIYWELADLADLIHVDS